MSRKTEPNQRPERNAGKSSAFQAELAARRGSSMIVSQKMKATVHEWNEPPPMDTGAPLPSVKKVGDHLWVAYLLRAPDDASGALLRFDGVTDYHFGGPSDERLHTHPLYAAGLGFYGFYEAQGTSRLTGQNGKKHWIITFHDETFEVVADSAVVVSRKIEGENTHAMVEERG